jgi:molybdopterin synthase catalytic subunit
VGDAVDASTTMTATTAAAATTAATPSVRIQEADFDVGAELAALQGGRTDIGAVASFVGCVRGHTPGDAVSALTLEHYPGMTERSIEDMIREAGERFSLLDARVIHRVGRLLPGERIVLVATASSHRRDAFQSCEFLMDYLKTHAPFWKKESTPDGERWVDARVADDAALRRWGIASGNAGNATAHTDANTIVDAAAKANAGADANAKANVGANADADAR